MWNDALSMFHLIFGEIRCIFCECDTNLDWHSFEGLGIEIASIHFCIKGSVYFHKSQVFSRHQKKGKKESFYCFLNKYD